MTPNERWKAGAYQLVVETGLEDLAGNHIGQPFDIDVFERVTEHITTGTISLPFNVRWPFTEMRNRMRSGLLAALALLASMASAQAAEIPGKEMSLPATERQVKVVYFRAPGEGKRPAALLLHGAGGFGRRLAAYSHYASVLASAGIDAYLVYYYSELDEKLMSSGGGSVFRQRYAAWAKEIDDLADYLVAQQDSNGKVGLIGFSNGGILATGASTLNPRINAAVIYYGTEPWPLGVPAERFPPLLVLHGDADQIIPVEQGQELAILAKSLGGKVDIVIYPNETHGFGIDMTKKNGVDALTRTIAFLKKELQGK